MRPPQNMCTCMNAFCLNYGNITVTVNQVMGFLTYHVTNVHSRVALHVCHNDRCDIMSFVKP